MLDTSQTAPMSASHLFALTEDHLAIRDMARGFRGRETRAERRSNGTRRSISRSTRCARRRRSAWAASMCARMWAARA